MTRLIIGCLLGLSGCGAKEEMVYFSSGSADTTYEQAAEPSSAQPEKLLVYVCGAVKEPGVVAVDTDARVVDAVALAGGMTEAAAENYVNLAAKLTDGEKVYIPTLEEAADLEGKEANGTLININTADKETLCTLPGIGESKAADIISYREKSGGFQTKEELMQVSGIKESLFNRLEDKIRVE